MLRRHHLPSRAAGSAWPPLELPSASTSLRTSGSSGGTDLLVQTPTAAAGDNTDADLVVAALYRERARDTPDRRRPRGMEPPEAPACAEPGDTVRTDGRTRSGLIRVQAPPIHKPLISSTCHRCKEGRSIFVFRGSSICW